MVVHSCRYIYIYIYIYIYSPQLSNENIQCCDRYITLYMLIYCTFINELLYKIHSYKFFQKIFIFYNNNFTIILFIFIIILS